CAPCSRTAAVFFSPSPFIEALIPSCELCFQLRKAPVESHYVYVLFVRSWLWHQHGHLHDVPFTSVLVPSSFFHAHLPQLCIPLNIMGVGPNSVTLVKGPGCIPGRLRCLSPSCALPACLRAGRGVARFRIGPAL